MRKIATILLSAFALTACNDDIAQQQEFIDQVKASTTPKVEEIPKLTKFEHFEYSARQLRSPFVAPQPEIIQNNMVQVKNCLHPDPDRAREPLEKYPLDNLAMKGTLGSDGRTWALIKAADESLHRVTIGDYLGLYHGVVKDVQSDFIELLELIPDGSGCWKERLTKLEMLEATTDGAS
ncbi:MULTISPECIES: pilus assembly protein PilP [unclassified Pseudoalteromonas]|uniref:pilus assembly protein PilP n=1 Tax=unclassified Pseudoalteromonas TaxID=194690 RepID=UPI000B3C0683|nr:MULTISPECIES: pilus assembly protein PilP [unclassified Pseudoalteromonas]MDN3379428.1 pilus assembly protein PilP [Pseudoalteromonas sp. APC 3893]MDN3386602.1 pilus assembly protein PilP [Pseudoalteromonas sp. APC 4017]OUS71413.1 pilus assembly protein PilP [Pseudoalteromonas sp. A601]